MLRACRWPGTFTPLLNPHKRPRWGRYRLATGHGYCPRPSPVTRKSRFKTSTSCPGPQAETLQSRVQGPSPESGSHPAQVMGPLGVAWASLLAQLGCPASRLPALGRAGLPGFHVSTALGTECAGTRAEVRVISWPALAPVNLMCPGHPNTKWGLCAKNHAGTVQIPNVDFSWAVGVRCQKCQ